MKTYIIDIDGVLCDDRRGDYKKANPNYINIKKINELYNDGNYIKLFTGRGSATGIDWAEVTYKQLRSWGVKYHEIIFGKPVGDIFIDDKALNVKDW